MYLDRQLIAGAVELLMRRVRGLGSWSALERESGVSRSTLYSHRVDLERGQVTVVEVMQRNRQVKGVPKSRAGQRIVPLVPELRTALEPFLGGGLLFPGVDYTNWRRRVFVPARDAAQLADPQPTPHDLRHSFGSWLAAGGVPPTNIMALMGHSSLRATERYLHAGDGRFAQAVTALIGQ